MMAMPTAYAAEIAMLTPFIPHHATATMVNGTVAARAHTLPTMLPRISRMTIMRSFNNEMNAVNDVHTSAA